MRVVENRLLLASGLLDVPGVGQDLAECGTEFSDAGQSREITPGRRAGIQNALQGSS